MTLRNLRALLAAAVLAGAAWAPPAAADEAEAESCLRTKIWDGYNEGWAVRTATSATLAEAEYRIYLVNLYKGNEYKIISCGDEVSDQVDLVLHDAEGNVVLQSESTDRQPQLSYKPDITGTFYVVVHATSLKKGAGDKAGVGMAVTYR
jgi:hypothetical protein